MSMRDWRRLRKSCESCCAGTFRVPTPLTTHRVRAGGGELHNISALTGGLLAQEAIKIITKQYIPVDNVCLFDGVRSRSAVLRL